MAHQLIILSAGTFGVLAGDCDCSWTHGGSDCGQDDGSKCWRECCGSGPGPGPSPPGPSGGGTYCPSLGDFDIIWGNVGGEGNGWRVSGQGGIHGRTSFNLLGGYIDFDMDACAGQQGMNNNFYTVSPSGGMGSGYCDIQACNDGSCPTCMELDIVENNGNTNGRTTWHTWGSHDGGCDRDGCYGSFQGCKYHFRTEFAEDGGIKQFVNGAELQVNQHGSLGSAEKGEIVKNMNNNGAALISTQWQGWCPDGIGASRGRPYKKNLTSATTDSNDFSFAVTNVVVHAPRGIKYGQPPPACQGPTPDPSPSPPGPPPAPSPSGQCQTFVGKNNDGTNLKSTADITNSAGECCDRCASADGCVGYTWVHANNECWLKSAVSAPRGDDCGGCVTSGTFDRPAPPTPVPPPPTPVPPPPTPGPAGCTCGCTGDDLAQCMKGCPTASFDACVKTCSSPCPTPPPSPGPSGCPGGSLSACIKMCPSDDPVVFKVCADTCTKDCSGSDSCTGGDDGSSVEDCISHCPTDKFTECISCCQTKFPSLDFLHV